MERALILRPLARIDDHAQRKRSIRMNNSMTKSINRRSFVRGGLTIAGATTMGAGLLTHSSPLLAQGAAISAGDAALLRFAAAAEILESDFWVQYNELGGIPDTEVPGGTGNKMYTSKLANLDADFAQYIHDNTDDEITHFTFLNAYLESKGAEPANLDQFRTLQGSTATGVNQAMIGKRLTNLTELTLDTSWWTRYRSDANNPDLDPSFAFAQAVPDLAAGPHTAIPRTDDDLRPHKHLQAIANTAAFHMPTIEQGGNSLYPSMAQRASSVEVLRILISIGPTETMHFQTWSDKAGNACSRPLAPLTDPTNGLTFPDLNSAPFGGETFQTNLIMPEPCPFLDPSLPTCSIIRPTQTAGVAMGVVKFLTDMGLFMGQSQAFFTFMHTLAAAADAATRGA